MIVIFLVVNDCGVIFGPFYIRLHCKVRHKKQVPKEALDTYKGFSETLKLFLKLYGFAQLGK